MTELVYYIGEAVSKSTLPFQKVVGHDYFIKQSYPLCDNDLIPPYDYIHSWLMALVYLALAQIIMHEIKNDRKIDRAKSVRGSFS